ncbi:hypothetical protein ACFL6U_06540 [Planctomycetota bacterium]
MQGLAGVGMSNMFRTPHLERMADKLIEHKDANGDGTLNVTELGGPESSFARIDTNANGQVDKAELVAHTPRPMFNHIAAHMIQQLDTDESDTLSIEESGLSEALIVAIDQNQDNELDNKELGGFLKHLNQVTDSASATGAQPGRPGGIGGQTEGTETDEEGDTEETVTVLDTDNDGQSDQEQTTIFYPQLNIYQTTTVHLNTSDTRDDPVYL